MSQFKGFRPRVDQPPGKGETIDRSSKDLLKTRRAAESLYLALTHLWTCSDHSEHSANLRLSLELGEWHLPLSTDHFSIAVTNWAVETYNESEQPVELHIETTMEKLSSDLEEQEISGLQCGEQKENVELQLVESLLAKLGDHQGYRDDTRDLGSVQNRPVPPRQAPQGKKAKEVRFEDDWNRAIEHSQLGNLHLVDLCSGFNLCSRFHRLPLLSGGACVGYLPGQGTSIHRSQPQNYVFAGAESLALLLSQRQPDQMLNKLEKWKLTGALSMAASSIIPQPGSKRRS